MVRKKRKKRKKHKKLKTKRRVVRIAGKLKEIVTVHDHKGKVLHKIMSPLMVEFHITDILQIMIGAAILAVPVGFTEETWRLGESLPLTNVLILLLFSLLFIAVFVYYNYYKHGIKNHRDEYIKRVIATYVFSYLVVAALLGLIQRTPWITDWILSFKRVVIVTFPASMSAAVADILK